MKRISYVALACSLLALALGPVSPASGAAPELAKQFADFDGDGYGDLAIGAPLEAIGGLAEAGAVTVLYGSASGVDARRTQQWHQDVPGVESDGAEKEDHFGHALAAGDFDGDGFDDLAVGVPWESIDSNQDPVRGGVVQVLYGSSAGLAAARSQWWWYGVFPESVPRPYMNLGTALVAGDVDADGKDDLFAGGPGGVDGGRVLYFAGTASGLRPTSEIASPGRPKGTRFGSALAAGDFDGDGDADVAIGAPWDDVAASDTARGGADAGRVYVVSGSPTGPTGMTALDQDSPGINGAAEQGDFFGWALAAGDLDGDGKADLAVGSPDEGLTGSSNAGAVHVLPGSPAGPTGHGSQLWHQAVAGVPGAPEQGGMTNDRFGAALAAADFDGDKRADLAIGAVWDEVGSLASAGTVTVLHGTATLLSTARIRMWHQNVSGVAGSAEAGDGFGAAVGAGDVNADGRADLAIGVPDEDIGRYQGSGALHLLRGSATGLTAAGSSLWDQDVPGVPGANEFGDHFGWAVTG